MSFDLVHALAVASHFESGSDEWFAGLFHDAIEDGNTEDVHLVAGRVPWRAVKAVEVLTRRPDETYSVYIERVASDPIARQVKLADLRVNLLRMDEAHESLRSRYEKAQERLSD